MIAMMFRLTRTNPSIKISIIILISLILHIALINFFGCGLFFIPFLIIFTFVLIIISIYLIFRGNIKKALWLALVVFICFGSLTMATRIRLAIDLAKINVFTSKMLSCVSSSKIIKDNIGINICDRQDLDFVETTNTIVYDGSDEIILPFNARSNDWNRAARELHNAPFGVMGFSVRRLTGHFYDVQFSYSQPPDSS
jgi:hypothetical protein